MAQSVCIIVPGEEIMAGPQCCANPPNLNPGSGVGHVEELGGLKTYVNGSSQSKLGVLLVSDIFGTQPLSLTRLSQNFHFLFNYCFGLSSGLFCYSLL